MQRYSFTEFINNCYSVLVTKILLRQARILRQPSYIRGVSSIVGAKKLTTGYSCRFDLPGHMKTLFIGNNCEMGDNVHIVASQKVIIGNNVLLAARVFISDTNHGNYSGLEQDSPTTPPNYRSLTCKTVEIGDDVWIGENVVILPGVKIGRGAIVGANSVVTKDVAPETIVAGTPARLLKSYDKELKKWCKVID